MTGTKAPKLAQNNAITSVVCHLARLTPNAIMKVVLKNIASNIVRAIMKKATENVFVLLTIIYLPVRLTLFVLPVKENILLTAANQAGIKKEINVFAKIRGHILRVLPDMYVNMKLAQKNIIKLTAVNPDMTKLEMNVFFMFTIIFARTATRKTIYGKIRL